MQYLDYLLIIGKSQIWFVFHMNFYTFFFMRIFLKAVMEEVMKKVMEVGVGRVIEVKQVMKMDISGYRYGRGDGYEGGYGGGYVNEGCFGGSVMVKDIVMKDMDVVMEMELDYAAYGGYGYGGGYVYGGG